MLQPLEGLHRPGTSLYREYTQVAAASDAAAERYRYGPNRIEIGAAAVDIGFSIDTTIDWVAAAGQRLGLTWSSSESAQTPAFSNSRTVRPTFSTLP